MMVKGAVPLRPSASVMLVRLHSTTGVWANAGAAARRNAATAARRAPYAKGGPGDPVAEPLRS